MERRRGDGEKERMREREDEKWRREGLRRGVEVGRRRAEEKR